MTFSAEDANKISASAIEEARRKQEKERKEKEEEQRKQVLLTLTRYEEHESYINNNAREIMRLILQETIKSCINQIKRAASAGHIICELSPSYNNRGLLHTNYPQLTDDDISHILFYINEDCRCGECIPCRVYGPTHRYWIGSLIWRARYKPNPFWARVGSFLKSKGFKVRYIIRSERLSYSRSSGCVGSSTYYTTEDYMIMIVSWG